MIFSQQHELRHDDIGVAPCGMGVAVRPVVRPGESDFRPGSLASRSQARRLDLRS